VGDHMGHPAGTDDEDVPFHGCLLRC
jgi:hypothetical protein